MNNLQNINVFSSSHILYSYCKIVLAFTKLVFTIKQAFVGKKKKILKECRYLPELFWTVFTKRHQILHKGDCLVDHFCTVFRKNKSHSQNKHDLCLLSCPLLQVNLRPPTFGAVSVSLGSCCHIASCC